MKTVTIGLLVMVLLAMVMLSGCQHEHSASAGPVTWQPTQTGFWHPEAE